MKMFNWVQNKLSGRHVSKKKDLISSANCYSIQQEPGKEEVIDWPQGLLAIGTIGNNDLNDLATNTTNLQENPSFSKDVSQDLSSEEIGKLQNELNLFCHEHNGSTSTATESEARLLVNEFLNLSSSQAEERSNEGYCEDSNNHQHVQPNRNVAFSRDTFVCIDNTKNALLKKTVLSLVKKMIACTSGFAPARSLRDPVAESRMGKLLRAIVHKKIYPQSSSTKLSTKKYLEIKGRHAPNKSAKEDEVNKKAQSRSKWVKTDSEYIVLEI